MSGRIIPTMQYADAPAAIDWLERAFGFSRHLVVEDGDGGIAHAQLRFGNGMIMLSTDRDDAHGSRMARPAEIGGRQTQSCYIIVEDVDGLCARAREAGAEITRGPEDTDYGSREFGCLDPEGFLWNFGSYDPWA